jgi:hypothetical protein
MTDETDRLQDAADAYRASLPVLDARLDDRVMATVRARAAAQAPTPARRRAIARWFVEARVRPVWVPLGAAAAALLVWFGAPSRGPVVTPTALAARAADTVFVQFQLTAPGAQSVAVAGSFNNWDPATMPMTRSASGGWIVTVPLPVGEHTYQFVVDGRWVVDSTAHAQVDDGFGGVNSVIVVGPKGLVRT